jgi:hypothetical protein
MDVPRLMASFCRETGSASPNAGSPSVVDTDVDVDLDEQSYEKVSAHETLERS